MAEDTKGIVEVRILPQGAAAAPPDPKALAQQYDQLYVSGKLQGQDLARYEALRPQLIEKGLLPLGAAQFAPPPSQALLQQARNAGRTGIAMGATGEPVFVESGSTISNPPSFLEGTAIPALNRYGPPLIAGYLTGGMSPLIQLGAQLAVTGGQQFLGIEPRRLNVLDPSTYGTGLAPYAETALAQGMGMAGGRVLQGILRGLPPGQKYLADQTRTGLQRRIGQTADAQAFEQAQFQRQINQALGQGEQAQADYAQQANRAIGKGVQRQAELQGGLESFAAGTQRGVTQAEYLTRQAQEEYGLVKSALLKTGDDLRRFKALQQLQGQAVREESAVQARTWLDTLPVPDETTLARLYGEVDKFNGNRVPQSLVTDLNTARQELAAKEARIAALVPEATNPQLRRLGQAGTAMQTTPAIPAGLPPGINPASVLQILGPDGQPLPLPTAPPPPTFQAVRDTLTRLGQRIGDARTGVNMGQTGAREELAAVSKLYGTLQTSLDNAVASGELTPAAQAALQEANAAFKVSATVEDLRGLLTAQMRTPEGGAEIFKPGAVLTALQQPRNQELRDKLAEIGVLPKLEAFLQDLQAKLAAPKNALLKARELEFTAKGIMRQASAAEQQTVQQYTDAAAAMQHRLAEGTQLVQGEQAAVGKQAAARAEMLQSQGAAAQQQAGARAEMLKSQQQAAATEGQETLQDLQRRLGAVPQVTLNAPVAFGYTPVAAGSLAGVASGSPQVGMAVGGGLEVAALLSRALMTPRGQEIVGKILEGSGGLWTPQAMAVLAQVAREPLMQGMVAGGTQAREGIESFLRNYGRLFTGAK